MESQGDMKLVEKIFELHLAISKLPSLHPSEEVNFVFSELVLACIPPSPVDVSQLGHEAQDMRSSLIKLCSQAEGLLETHYSELLASFPNPLDHLTIFPYFSNYVKLSLLEHTLVARHCARPPARVAFLGSGPLPLTSIVLATRHLRSSRFHNYDIDGAANEHARTLVAADPDLSVRMTFHTANVLTLGEDLREYDLVFLAALVGVGREEKGRVLAYLASHMAPGALLVVRSAWAARAFLYPVVDPCDLVGFKVLSVYHPEDEVVNSVIVARKAGSGTATGYPVGEAAPLMLLPCNCCCEVQALNGLGHGGGIMEEMALEEQIS